MKNKVDILIVGAATSGVYFGWIMAKKGHSVLIIDKEKREEVAKRLEIIHFVKDTFNELKIPPPEGPSELIGSWKGIWVSRLPKWLQKMYAILESIGVEFEFNCTFKECIYENDKIIGAKVEKDGNAQEIRSRLVVDASGVACTVRSSLPENYGIETWNYDSSNRFFVILHYIKWAEKEKEHPIWGELWPYYFVFLDPGYMGDHAIMGLIGPESFKVSEKIMEEFLEIAKLPPFDLLKREFASFPLTLSPNSIIGDGFLCIGDAAAIMNPIAARGIPETWKISSEAAEIIDKELNNDDYLSKEKLWQVNVKYFRGVGAELAYQYMITPAIFNINEKEVNFLLKKLRHVVDPPGDDEDMDIKLSAGKLLKIFVKILGAIFTGKVKLSSIGSFIKHARIAGKFRKHYRKYPTRPEDLEEWKQKANKFLEKRKVNPREFRSLTVQYP